ncbi:MAG: ATP-binding cassette domain-containing protein [Methylocystaceae bacterium]|nr:ATP-binding cassette domain-containing protein [Methylocystaceae bacterium]
MQNITAVNTRCRVFTPTHLQTQTTECGLAAMAMVLSHHGRYVTLDELRVISGVSRDCITAADLVRIARHYDLTVQVKRKEPEDFINLGFPFIAYLDFIHFVVIEGVTADGVWINDPSNGRHFKDKETFSEAFTGITLTFSKGASFEAGGDYVTTWKRVLRHLSMGSRLRIFASMMAGIFTSLPQIIFALAFGQVVAHISAKGSTNLTDLTLLFFLLAAAVFLNFLFHHIAIDAEHRVERHYIRDRLPRLAHHLLTMPYAFFVYRIAAVLHQRIYEQETVATSLFRTFLPTISRGFNLIILLAGFLYVDQYAGLIAAGLCGFFVIFLYMLEQMANVRSRTLKGMDGVIWSKLSQALENFESFKTSGGDESFFRNNMGDLSRKLHILQKVGLFRSFAEAGADLVPVFLGLALLVRCAYGDVDVAAMFSLLCLTIAIHSPVRALALWHGEGHVLDQQLPPIDDLIDQGGDENGQMSEEGEASASPYILSASHISFGFTKVKPALLQDIDLGIMAGEQLGITGPSGGGKSTLAEVLIGLHQPWTGSVQLKGVPLCRTNRADLIKDIGWVNKHSYFIAGTVRDNILLWDNTISEADISAAIHDACLTQTIEDCPEGLETQVAPRGANFSGGQRQRLEIARALARNPRILVLDEATDGLDDALEADIRENLRNRDVTLLIVSHRENTLKACDRVIHLIDGQMSLSAKAEMQPASFAKASTQFMAEETPELTRRPSGDRRADLIKTFRWVAEAVSEQPITIPETPLPQEGDHADEQGLEILARHNRLPLRYARFVSSKWWTWDHGPFIAFTRDGHLPVAILDDGANGFVLANPSTDSRRPLTSKEIKGLETQVVLLHDDFKTQQVKPLSFFVHAFLRCRADLKSIGGATIALSILMLGMPFAGYFFLHEILPYRDAEASWFFIGGLLFLSLSIMLAESFRLIAIHRFDGRLEASTSQALYQHVMRIQPLFFHDNSPEVINRSLHAVPHILKVLREGTLRRLLASLGCFICLWVLANFSPVLALCACLILLVFASVAVLLSRQALSSVGPHLTQRLINLDFLFQLFKNAPRLRQMGCDDSALEVWKKGREDELLMWDRIRKAENRSKTFIETYPFFALALFVLAIGLVPDVRSPALVGTLVVTFMAALLCMKGTASALCDLVRIVPFLSRLKPLAQAMVEARHSPVTLDERTCPIEVKGLHFTYPGSTVETLKDVSLRVKPGQIVTLVGASGCGKSTLLRVLLGFYPIDSGKILRHAKNEDEIDLSSWRDRVGAVFQDDQLEFAMTIRGHIMGQGFYTMAKTREAARLAMLEPDLDAMPMGIQTIVDSDKISTGQKQRILIAQRLIREPMLLILDEATNALPETMQADFFVNLRKLGISCLLVSHRASAISASDYVYHMQDGQIAWSGVPSDFDASKLAQNHKGA